jgi:N-acetylglutamate synthase-like GNAT family acetyltransferase
MNLENDMKTVISRRANRNDLSAILSLYAELHPDDPAVAPADASVRDHWDKILAYPHLVPFVLEMEGTVVSTCMLTMVPNLTRGMRPYGLIENVVTAPDRRKQGHGSRLLRHALAEAWKVGCYKVMLLTGSKREETLRFYENAGFEREVKTGFVAYPSG